MSRVINTKHLFALFLFTATAGADGGVGLVATIAQENVSPSNLVLVRRTLASFEAIMHGEIGVRLDHPVKLFLCAGTNGYQAVLEKEFGTKTEQAARSARVTGGMSKNVSNGGLIAVRFDGEGVSAFKAYQVLSHELFYQIQGQLARGSKGRGLYFMSEGTADYVAAVVSAKLGQQSLERWKLERLNAVRSATTNAAPHEILRTDLNRWTTLMEMKLHPYEVADLMVFQLMEENSEAGLRPIAQYYQNLGAGSNGPGAFCAAFGITEEAFVTRAAANLDQSKKAQAGLQILPWKGTPMKNFAEFEAEARALRLALAQEWGWDLFQSRRLLVAATGADMLDAREKDLGQTLTDLDRKTGTKSRWYWAGNTALFRLDTNLAAPDRRRDLATLYVSMLQQEQAARSNLDRLAWLNLGVMELAFSELNGRSPGVSPENPVKTWTETWQKKSNTLTLASLRKPSDLMTNQIRHGTRPVAALCALAARELSIGNGPSAFKAYYQGLKKRSDVEALFQEIFGKDLSDFEQHFIQALTKP